MVANDLVFVKTANAASGRVEVHVAWAKGGFQTVEHYVTVFNMGEVDNGTWTMADMEACGRPDLVFIKTANAGSGHVEVDVATVDSDFQILAPHVTAFNIGDGPDGTWAMADMDGDGRPDLVFIKTANAGSGHVEIHVATAASGFQTVEHYVTWFSPADGPNGTWLVAPFFPMPKVDTGPASQVTDNSATLHGEVNPMGSVTGYHFEYGTTVAYGLVAPSPDHLTGAQSTVLQVGWPIENLTPGTTYHFRLVATNPGGTNHGNDLMLHTQG